MPLDQDLLSIQEARNLISKAKKAFVKLSRLSQDDIDRIIKSMVQAGSQHSERLAKMAVEETRFGIVEDKIIKNKIATEDLYNSIKDMKTVGLVSRDADSQIYTILEPFGLIGAIIPSTNPTSTAMYKIIIAIKSRNGIVIAPHPSAKKCSKEATDVLIKAATDAGAPEGIIGCISNPTMPGTEELMKHRDVDFLLATGGIGLVRAAYGTGKPAFGVGPGNVPVFVDASADIRDAVRKILISKTFDNGTVCASEQSIVVETRIEKTVREELQRNGFYFLNRDEYHKLAPVVVLPNGSMNPKSVGQNAKSLATMAGLNVPSNVKVFVAELEGVGKDYPISGETLTAAIGFYVMEDKNSCIDRCLEIVNYGGRGHTAVIHTTNEELVIEYAMKIPVTRILVNTPSSQGAVGGTTALPPSMTLGPGTWGGSVISDNISPLNLLNKKRVAFEKATVGIGQVKLNDFVTAGGYSTGDIEEIVREVYAQISRVNIRQ